MFAFVQFAWLIFLEKSSDGKHSSKSSKFVVIILKFGFLFKKFFKISEISSLNYGDRIYDYDGKRGYFNIKNLELKSANDFGYEETCKMPKIAILLLDKLAFVEDLQKGIIKIHTSSHDKNGYIMFLAPEFIIEITQKLDSKFLYPIKTSEQETQTEFNLLELNNFEPIEVIGNLDLIEDINN